MITLIYSNIEQGMVHILTRKMRTVLYPYENLVVSSGRIIPLYPTIPCCETCERTGLISVSMNKNMIRFPHYHIRPITIRSLREVCYGC